MRKLLAPVAYVLLPLQAYSLLITILRLSLNTVRGLRAGQAFLSLSLSLSAVLSRVLRNPVRRLRWPAAVVGLVA